MSGESLVKICSDESMPNRVTVIRWMGKDEAFATKCARAREAQADLMDDKILDVADKCTAETAQADRVKIAAYQWRAAKLAPKKYGERIVAEHMGKDGGPIQSETTEITMKLAPPRTEDEDRSYRDNVVPFETKTAS